MANEPAQVPWDDLPIAEQKAAMEVWWAKANPAPDSDEYLYLVLMSGERGDPNAAKQELIRRGLIEPEGEHRATFTEAGKAMFFALAGKVMTVEPTSEGLERYPPDGWFRTDFHGVAEELPCTCRTDCPEWCEGQCGCEACKTRLEVFGAEGSAYGEQ